MRRLELIGKKISMLTVMSYSHSHIQPSGQKRAVWDVKCDCGTEKKMSTGTLIHGKNTVSCGCYFKNNVSGKQNIKPKGEAHLNYKYLAYKARCRNSRKKIDFLLTKDEFKEIIFKDCFYCDAKPSMMHLKKNTNGYILTNGIDRIDSSKGYEKDNCVPCCKICNTMKNSLDVDDFLKHIERIHSHVKKRL